MVSFSPRLNVIIAQMLEVIHPNRIVAENLVIEDVEPDRDLVIEGVTHLQDPDLGIVEGDQGKF